MFLAFALGAAVAQMAGSPMSANGRAEAEAMERSFRAAEAERNARHGEAMKQAAAERRVRRAAKRAAR